MLPFLSSLRNSLNTNRLFSFLSSGDDENLGYITYPRLINNPSLISFFPKSKELLVFSETEEQVVFLNSLSQEVTKRFSTENTKPKYPSSLLPQINTIFYAGEGGIDEDGIYSIDSSGKISTIVAIGSGDIIKITDSLYNPNDNSIYFLDEGLFNIHKINASGEIQLNYITLNTRSNELPQFAFDSSTNNLFIRDTDNNFIHVINLTTFSQSTISLSFRPLGIVWSEEERLLYILGIVISQSEVYELISGELIKLDITFKDYPGVIVGSQYDSIKQQPIIKLSSSLLGQSNLLYLKKLETEIVPTNSLFAEFDFNIPFLFVESNSSFYIPLPNLNTIREYKNLQSINQIKVAPFEYNNLISLFFENLKGIFIYGSKVGTIYSEDFNVRNTELVFSSLFSSITSTDNLIYAKWLKINEEELLFLAFNNGKLLAVNEQFSVVSDIQIENLAIPRNSNQVSVNPSSSGPYFVTGVDYSSSFKLFYVSLSNGKAEGGTKNGITLCYNVSTTIGEAIPVAFVTMPSEVNSISSISINPISGNLLISGEGDNNSIIRIVSLVPELGNLPILSSRTASSNLSNSVYFSGKTYLGSLSGELISLGNSVTASLQETSLTSIKQLSPSSEFRFLYGYDSQNNYIFTINTKGEAYGINIFNDSLKAITPFQDNIYALVDQPEISLPSLSLEIASNTNTNRIDFVSSINTNIEVGDVITITQGSDNLFLTSLSKRSSEDTSIFVNSFNSSITYNPSTTIVSIKGSKIYQISQEPFISIRGQSKLSFFTEINFPQDFNKYYTSSYSPYFLTNALNSSDFQSVNGVLKSLGGRLTRYPQAPKFTKNNFIFFQADNKELFRINLINLSVQQVQLLEAPNLNLLKDFLIKDDYFVFIINQDNNIYQYSLKEDRIDRLQYQEKSILDLGYQPDNITYNEAEDLINVYSFSKIDKVIINI